MSNPTDKASVATHIPHHEDVEMGFRALLERGSGIGDMDWQPIKSAPKDNTKVLIYVPSKTINGHDYDAIIMVSRFKGYWWDAAHLKPTHWMPLPEPPKDCK